MKRKRPFKSLVREADKRKARRIEKSAENAALKASAAPQDAPGAIERQSGRPRQPEPRKSKPRRKKSLFVRLRDALDKEAQKYAAERDRELGCRIRKAGKCTGQSEVGYHLIPRGKWAVRWDLDFRGIGNIVGACNSCNAGENWHRLDYAEHHKKLFGADFYQALWEKSHEKVKHSSLDLQRMRDEIRRLRDGLGQRTHADIGPFRA